MFNKLLLRQLQKHLGNTEDLPEEYMALFQAISDSYEHYEKDRRMLERSIDLSSGEMIGLNNSLREEKDELRKTYEQLESRNRMLEQFGYIVSHDLQEPLRTISSFVQLFQKRYIDKLDDKGQQYLNFIIQSSNRMKVLIHDLLDYSRIGSQHSIEKIDCNQLLQEVLSDLANMVSEANAVIQAADLPIINGYATEIKQLFQNLITNAIKFRKKDVPPIIKVTAQHIDSYFRFAIEDNGIGIEKENYEKIFVIFQRLHRTSEYDGSGIGLSNCKKIVELHKGEIWVNSTLGKGSIFYFTIPAND